MSRGRRRGGVRGRRNLEKKSRGRQGAGAARGAPVPAEIVQDAAGNLHPFGLHDEDPQQEQCIPAPRGRGPRVRHGEQATTAAAAAAAAVPTKTRGGRGGTRSLPPGSLSLGPRGWAAVRGRSPGSHAPALLERPNGKLENRQLEQTKPMRRLFIGPSAPIRLQAAQLLLRKPTSRRLGLGLEVDRRMRTLPPSHY